MSKKRVKFDLESEDHQEFKVPFKKKFQKNLDLNDEIEQEEREQLNNEEDYEDTKLPFKKKFKHTLDSDESDDEIEEERKDKLDDEQFEEKYELNENDYEHKEDLFRDGEITITPFNIKAELKEGHFDKEGTFIFNKQKDEIKDHWIDNIDWEKVKELDETKEVISKSSKDEDTSTPKISKEECLKKLIELMNPNETVQKAIQRLGRSKFKNANRNKNRQRIKNQSGNSKKTEEFSKEEQEEKERKEKLNNLIELSNQLLSDGDMNIYETKSETLKYQLEETLKNKTELDMFAD